MFIEKITGSIADKKRWRRYRARVKALPPSYRTAALAVERQLMLFGGADGEAWASMFEDLAELFETAAADHTPIRDIVGEDPDVFVQEFIKNYSTGRWRSKEHRRFLNALEQAEAESDATDGTDR